MNIRIRQATLGDLDAVYDIWLEGSRHSLGRDLPEGVTYKPNFERQLREQDKNFKTWVVEEESGGLIAWTSIVPFRANPATRDLMGELSIYVRSESSHQNVARDLMFHALRQADLADLQYVVCYIAETNTRTIQFGQRGGFIVVGTTPPMAREPAGPALTYMVYPAGAWRAI